MPEPPSSDPDLTAPVEALAVAMELHLLPEERPGVAQTFATLHAIAQALLRFPLPDEMESAEVLQP
ncbi:MAG TPA: DUF4089 domain-containing protein [bacterium]|nr:DUF4089 domain-containing protein [bacterium]